MIVDTLDFDYQSAGNFSRSVVDARLRLAAWNGYCFILKDRIAKQQMSRFAVRVTDEAGVSAIELLLMGNTLYVLGMRLPGANWYVSLNQDKEFRSCPASVQEVMEFESGYGALGITLGGNTPRFQIDGCSVHVTALKTYMQTARHLRTAQVIAAAKQAFAYFAMTIGEATRFRSICARLSLGGIDPLGSLHELQHWVVDSCVRNSRFPQRIAVAGVHEKTSSELFKQAMAKLLSNAGAELQPAMPELLVDAESATAEAVKSLVQRSGRFEALNDKVWGAGVAAVFSGYFKNRLNGTQLAAAQKFVKSIHDKSTTKKLLSINNFAGIDNVLDK